MKVKLTDILDIRKFLRIVCVCVYGENCTRIWASLALMKIIGLVVMFVQGVCVHVCVSRYWMILVSNEGPYIPPCNFNDVPQMRKYHKVLLTVDLVNKC